MLNFSGKFMRPPNSIYLDYNATTPVDPEVAASMRPYLDKIFGNPSSLHPYGSESKMAIEKARRQVAGLLNCDAGEVVFTSGGTESNNWALKGMAEKLEDKGRHIITSAIEHPAVLEVCRYLQKKGFELSILGTDARGMVDLEELKTAIRRDTILISIMHANNEVGSIQEIAELASLARDAGICFHSDAAQSAGKIPVDVQKLHVDMLSIAGHKLYAPKGVGALYIRKGLHPEKLMHGAGHEAGRRAGTENLLEIVGLGMAAEIARRQLTENASHYRQTRDRLEELLCGSIAGACVNGHPEKRLPNTLSLAIPGIVAPTLLASLKQVAASAGSACHSKPLQASPVLEAMQLPRELALGTIRLSTGRGTTMREVEAAAGEIAASVRRIRKQ